MRIGGFFRGIRDAVKKAVSVTIGFVNDAVNVLIDVGGKIVRFTLDTAKKVARFVEAVVEKVVESIKQFIEFLQFLFAWDDIVDPAETESDSGFELPEAAEWFLDKLLGGSRKEEADLGPAATASASDENDRTPLQRAFDNLLEALRGIADVGARVFEGLVETIEAFVANPRRPELALVEILATFRDVGIQLL